MRTLITVSALLLPALASAVPGTLSHQGRISDLSGVPLEGSHDLTLSFWSADSGGTQLHSETITTDVTNGFYAVTVSGADASTFASDAVWLELSVDSGSALGARVPLHSVPWAFHANTARNVSGGIVDVSEVRIDGVPLINASGGTLSSLSCNSGEVPEWSGSAWGCTSLAHTHNASDIDAGVLAIARIPVGSTAGTVAAGNHGHADPDWADVTNRPAGLDDGDDNTTYTAGSGLTLSGTQFAVVDSFVNASGDTMNAEYPTLSIDHPDSGGESGIRFNSRLNPGSDSAFIIFEDDFAESWGTGPEDSRLTIGVGNDARQSATHSDELWLQGGGRLVSNVGSYDAELDAIVGITPNVSAAVMHEWRANNVVVMTLDSNGVLNPVGGLACPANMTSVAGGRLCVDNAHSGPADIHAAILDCRARQAHVCTHADMQQSCGVTGFNPYAGAAAGWYGDHAKDEVVASGNTDDEYLTWNRSICTTDGNNDGPAAQAGGTPLNYRCCQ